MSAEIADLPSAGWAVGPVGVWCPCCNEPTAILVPLGGGDPNGPDVYCTVCDYAEREPDFDWGV